MEPNPPLEEPQSPTVLGALLRQAREQRGWSLMEAALVLGTSKQHIYALETGATNNPTLRLIARLVIVYGIRPEAIIACAVSELTVKADLTLLGKSHA